MPDPTATTDQIIDDAERLAPGAPPPTEKRLQPRFAWEGLVAMILGTESGGRTPTMVYRAADLSAGGLMVSGSKPLPVGATGVMQIVRGDGRFALLGIEVRHCRYVGPMEHRTGIRFIPLPPTFSRQEFLDDNGNLLLLDPLLRQNLRR
jgi:hypothetical protein